MKRSDIDRKYTELVAGLLGRGYQIHTATMNGSQGEEAHVDLTDGKEILRVLMETQMGWDCYGNITTIRVGKSTDPAGHTIWNNHLDTRFEISYARITPDFYTTVEEGRRMASVRLARYKMREHSSRVSLGEAFKLPALRWLKRTQKGFKSAKVSDIESVTRIEKRERREPTVRFCGYEIKAKGKTFTLKAHC